MTINQVLRSDGVKEKERQHRRRTSATVFGSTIVQCYSVHVGTVADLKTVGLVVDTPLSPSTLWLLR